MNSELKTIIYLTDNTLEASLAAKCREHLAAAADSIPIISVSQRPIELGRNICLGEIGRNWISLYRQILAGLEAAETPYIGIAEHDCLYTREHLAWQPPRDDIFYYNWNHWLVQWGGEHAGEYTYWPARSALSQLVCHKALLRRSTEEILRMLEMGLNVERGQHFYGEPGSPSRQFRKAFVHASSGRPVQLQRYLKEYLSHYTSEAFFTQAPNLDIRHGNNFTGPKRGKECCNELPFWGKFADVMA